MSLQQLIIDWAQRALGVDKAFSIEERAFRMLEEAVELAQAVGLTHDDVVNVSEYVMGRPPGTVYEEVGGVGMTLMALAEVAGFDTNAAIGAALSRVDTPEAIAKCRLKNDSKPRR